MGYVSRSAATHLIVNTLPNASILCDTTLRDSALNPFPAIDFKGTLFAAYMDVILPNIRNTRGAANHINGFTLQLEDSGSTWRNAMICPDPSLWMDNSQVSIGNVELCGTTDISAYVQNNTVMYPRIYQHSADGDALYLYDVYCRLRLYFYG